MKLDWERFARQRLAHLPTPLELMPRLSARISGPKLWVKRDDCTGLATGGNKARKLEFLIAEALASNADVVVTQGAVQSSHARQTAAAAARCGLKSHLIFEERLASAPEEYARSGNVFLDWLFGATTEYRPGGTDMAATLAEVTQRLAEEGHRPYAIPGGGSNPTGALGYALCAFELLDQARAQNLRIDHIVHATGSAGTQAGLLAGLAAAGADIPVHGISVRFEKVPQEGRVHDLAQATAEHLGGPPVPRSAVIAYDGYVGAGYGHPTEAMVAAVRTVAELEGLLLDPVYSGKGMAGLLDLAARGTFASSDIPAGLMIGLAIGAFNASGVVFLGLSPIVMTLATNGIVQGLALVYSDGTPDGFASPAMRYFMTGRFVGLTPVTWFMIGFVVFALLLLTRTRFGRHIYAVGNGRLVARLSGVGVGRMLFGVYMLSGLCAALAGILLASFSGQASLGMGDDYLLPSIAVVAVGGALITGGRGHYLGMLGGVLLLTVISILLAGTTLPHAVRDIIYGLVVLGAVLALRERYT